LKLFVVILLFCHDEWLCWISKYSWIYLLVSKLFTICGHHSISFDVQHSTSYVSVKVPDDRVFEVSKT